MTLVSWTMYSTLQGALVGVTCANSNYAWASGGAWNSMKNATCTNNAGSGAWVASDYCLRML